MPTVRTGVVRAVVVPSPTWPSALRPQPYTSPGLEAARLWT